MSDTGEIDTASDDVQLIDHQKEKLKERILSKSQILLIFKDGVKRLS